MTKYYVGYMQGDNSYVYVASVDPMNVKVSVMRDTAMAFNNEDLAEDLKAIVSTLVNNQEYVVLKVTTDIEEVK